MKWSVKWLNTMVNSKRPDFVRIEHSKTTSLGDSYADIATYLLERG